MFITEYWSSFVTAIWEEFHLANFLNSGDATIVPYLSLKSQIWKLSRCPMNFWSSCSSINIFIFMCVFVLKHDVFFTKFFAVCWDMQVLGWSIVDIRGRMFYWNFSMLYTSALLVFICIGMNFILMFIINFHLSE